MTEKSEARQLQTVIRCFARAAPTYDQFAEVYRQMSSRLHARLDLLSIEPKVVLDLGCGSGHDLASLRSRYKKARTFGLDLSLEMLRVASPQTGRWRKTALVAADTHSLPLATGTVDLAVSNLMLPWCSDPHQIFKEIHRVLAPGGAILFTSTGPDTLIEYRRLWREIDQAEHVFGLLDMHDIGDAMVAAGFSAPVLDRENLTVDYPSLAALEHELRSTGASNISPRRRRGLISPRVRNYLRPATENKGRYQVSVELVHGHAWKERSDTGRTVKSQSGDGESTISLERLRSGLKRWTS